MNGMMTRRAWLCSTASACAAIAMAGCGAHEVSGGAQPGSGSPADAMRIASLKGPTSIGLVPLMAWAKDGKVPGSPAFSLMGSIEEAAPRLLRGDADIALLPANMASVLYAKTGGGIAALNVNTLGVLSVVAGDGRVSELADLAGATVHLAGKGAIPEYTVRYLLDAAGLSDAVRLEFKSEPDEVAALLVEDPDRIGVLPEPFATAACARSERLAPRIDLAEAWERAAGASGSKLVTGVTVVRRAFARDHPEAVRAFAAAHRASAAEVVRHPDAWAQAVADAGIVAKAELAARAIPRCNIVCLEGAEMRDALRGYLGVLYDADPASVGGSLPGEDFYLDVEAGEGA